MARAQQLFDVAGLDVQRIGGTDFVTAPKAHQTGFLGGDHDQVLVADKMQPTRIHFPDVGTGDVFSFLQGMNQNQVFIAIPGTKRQQFTVGRNGDHFPGRVDTVERGELFQLR